MAARVREVQRELAEGGVHIEGTPKLGQTRATVVRGWSAIGDILRVDGLHQLADEVARFVGQMEPVRSSRQWVEHDLIEWARQARFRDNRLTR